MQEAIRLMKGAYKAWKRSGTSGHEMIYRARKKCAKKPVAIVKQRT